MTTDVIVIGGGMAGLCAAIAARREGAVVRLVEAAPHAMRGGNLRHARNIRIPHEAPHYLSPGVYGCSEFAREMREISGGGGDPELIDAVSAQAGELATWLPEQGVVFQTRHIPFSRRTAFFLGGGKAVTNALYARAEKLGVDIEYDAAVHGFDILKPPARAVVLCCGGGQASASQRFINRGTPFNTGFLMENLIRSGAATTGDATVAHLVAIDARSPAHDGGIVTRIDGMQFGMVVDRAGQRFVEEETITGSRRYPIWGKTIADLPVPQATLVVDADGMQSMPVLAFSPLRAETLADMAVIIGVDPSALAKSAGDCGRVRRGPFFSYPITPGITFSCLGLQVDRSARVKMRDGAVLQNVFAAGATMAAGVLRTGYLSGTALTISAVFGRIAGQEAARHAHG